MIENRNLRISPMAQAPLAAERVVPYKSPLIFFEKIADFAIQKLNKKGSLFFEINEKMGERVVELLHDKGFKDIELRKDLNNKDRMVKCFI